MVRFAWPGWWLGLLLGMSSPAVAQTVRDPLPSVELKENYPNPFYPSTTIPFVIHEEVCQDGHRPIVTLKIFNVLAQEVAVATLASDSTVRLNRVPLPCGEHEAFWNGQFSDGKREVAPGVFWYGLTVDGTRYVRSMIAARRVTSER
jgi:hypothetical protein